MKEDTLDESERRLANAQRIARIGSWEWDIVTDHVAWSDECFRIFGLEPGQIELTAERIMSFLVPEDAERTSVVFQNAIDTGESYEVEYRINRPDGPIAHVIGRGEVSERAPDGQVIRISGTVQDITERKEADNAVRELNESLQTQLAMLRRRDRELANAQRIARIGSWEWDVGTGHVEWSDECFRIFGFEPGGFEPTFDAVIPHLEPEGAERVRAAIQNTIETGEPYEVEYRIKNQDGTMIDLIGRAEILERAPDGEVISLTGTVQDITERKRVENAILELTRSHETRLELLSQREGELAEAQRLAHLGSWELIVADGTVIWSDEAYRIFGVEPQEFETTYEAIMPRLVAADAERMAIVIQDAIRTGKGYEVEYSVIRPDGSIAHTIGRGEVSERTPDGNVSRLRGTVQDITERKQAADAVRELNESLETRLELLSQREQELAEAQRLAKVGSWEWVLDTGEIIWSDEAFRVYGLEPVKAGPDYEAIMKQIPPEDAERISGVFQHAIETGESYEVEHRVILPDGTVRTLMSRGEISERDADREVSRLRGTVQDITERKQADDAVRELNDSLENQLELLTKQQKELAETQRLAHMGSWEWNVADGTVIWSDESYRIWGVEPDTFETTFENITAAIPPDEADLISKVTQHAVETGESYEVEHQIIRPDGTIRHVMERGEVSVWDENGQPTRVRGSMLDITELKLAALEIETLNRELEQSVQSRTTALEKEVAFSGQLIETAQAIILILDGEGRIVQFNRYLEEMTGYSLDEVRGKDWFETFVPADEVPEIVGVFENAMQGNRTRGKINGMMTKAGKILQIEWYDALVPDETGETTNLLAIGQDVTERQQIQAQLIQSSKMANLGEMATGVAHELNQPLNVIKLATENIFRRTAEGKAEEAYLLEKLEKIDAQVTRASTIVDNMRIFGRKPDSEPSILNLTDAVTGTATLTSERLRLAGIDLKIESSKAPVNVLGQLVQLEQVILNLVNNARDSILESNNDNRKEIAISVSANHETGLATLGVRDSGGGIASDTLDRVFEPFFTTKEIGKGTGLGLSISYGIITDMGGRIEARNHENGADFLVKLPLANTEQQLGD